MTISRTASSSDYASPFVKISERDFLDAAELEKKLLVAARVGLFYLEIPSDCKPYIEKAVYFANSFYSQENLKKLELEGFSGYHAREFSQVEAFHLRKEYWDELLS